MKLFKEKNKNIILMSELPYGKLGIILENQNYNQNIVLRINAIGDNICIAVGIVDISGAPIFYRYSEAEKIKVRILLKDELLIVT